MRHQLRVNGREFHFEADASLLLIDAIREHCQLTGANQGCDTAQCGTCTVLIDGAAVKACNLLAAQVAADASVTTIEGLAIGDVLHPMQVCFSTHHALQCGFCTPGMILRAVAMEAEGVAADDRAVRHALAGNLCRCTGYEGIVAAVVDGLQQMRAR
ncbi:MAG: (2Fe-2S)-binding protein [Betaproteobacteria bacterium]|nr:MAG: (2Fe-2S)-binding protein [Betaproteobacteria bacterium]